MALEQVPTGYKLKRGSDACPGIFAQTCILLSCMMVCQKIKKVILLKNQLTFGLLNSDLLCAEILSYSQNPTETNIYEVIES